MTRALLLHPFVCACVHQPRPRPPYDGRLMFEPVILARTPAAESAEVQQAAAAIGASRLGGHGAEAVYVWEGGEGGRPALDARCSCEDAAVGARSDTLWVVLYCGAVLVAVVAVGPPGYRCIVIVIAAALALRLPSTPDLGACRPGTQISRQTAKLRRWRPAPTPEPPQATVADWAGLQHDATVHPLHINAYCHND